LRDKLGIATIADVKMNFNKELKMELRVIKNDLVKISKNKKHINRNGNYDSDLTIDIN
jgi:hypothetical protein